MSARGREHEPVAVPHGFFVVRTPLLPWDELAAWSADLLAPSADAKGLDAALAHDREM